MNNFETRIEKLEKGMVKVRAYILGVIVFLIVTLIWAIATGAVNCNNLA